MLTLFLASAQGAKRVNSVGHVRLMKAIRNFGLMRKPGQITLECQVGLSFRRTFVEFIFRSFLL